MITTSAANVPFTTHYYAGNTRTPSHNPLPSHYHAPKAYSKSAKAAALSNDMIEAALLAAAPVN